MCRLYGFRASEATQVECALVHAQNALLHQSRMDRRGEVHPDGWGIAWYEDGRPRVERSALAAFEDGRFNATAARVRAATVIAHVRQGTFGAPALENTHPFTYGPWTFAHNGTLRAFERVAPHLEGETPPRFLSLRRGATDSEAMFLWFLGRMAEAGLDPDRTCTDLPGLGRLLATVVPQLDDLSVRAEARRPSKLNFLLTDGQVLAASRWRQTLHWVERENVRDCELCGIPHVREEGEDGGYRAVVVASEPISDEAWQEVPDPAVLTMDATLRVTVEPM